MRPLLPPFLLLLLVMREVHALTTTTTTTTTHTTHHQPGSTIPLSSSAAAASFATTSDAVRQTAGLGDGGTRTSPSLIQRVTSTHTLPPSSSVPPRLSSTTKPPNSTVLPSLAFSQSPTSPPVTTVPSSSPDPPHTTLTPHDPPLTPSVSLSYSSPPASTHPPPPTVSPSFIHPPSTRAPFPLSTDPPPATSPPPPPATQSTAFVTVHLLPTTTIPPPYTTAPPHNVTTTVPTPHATAFPPTTTTTDWPASTPDVPPSVVAPPSPSTPPPPLLTTAPPPPTTTTPASPPLPFTTSPPPLSTTVLNLYSTITPPQPEDYHSPHALTTTTTLPSTSTLPPPVTTTPPQEYPLSYAHASHLRQRPYFPAFRSTSSPTYSVGVPTLHPPASLPFPSFLAFHTSSSPPLSSSRTPVRIERTIPSTPPPQPYFDPSAPSNISAQLGAHAYLPCRIRNLANQSISWIRSRDSHILTVDRYTFISDQRFQAWHEPDSETWTLQVKYVQERDDGRYECQVSTEPKMSHFVRFHVVTPLIRIPGGPDMFVKSGSPVTIKCIITAALEQPDYIFWYQGQRRVIDGEGGGWKVELERVEGQETVGTLLIPRATSRDQGDYTCAPASLPNATVTLHVLNGEHPAAMHGGGPRTRPSPSPLFLCSLFTCWLLGRPLTPSLCPR